jgi:hypothetical protein
MKPHLLFVDADYVKRAPPWNAEALTRDLVLDPIFESMAQGDKLVDEICRELLLDAPRTDAKTILHRQNVLSDALRNASAVRQMYALAAEAVAEQKKHYLGAMLARHPDWTLRWAIGVIAALSKYLRRLRRLADDNVIRFRSPQWQSFFVLLQQELSDSKLAHIDVFLRQLQFKGGVAMSAALGPGNAGSDYIIHKPPPFVRLKWWQRWFRRRPRGLWFALAARDESGHRMLEELRDRVIAMSAQTLAQSADHVRDLFALVQTELAFYVGCLNLHEALAHKGLSVSTPRIQTDHCELGFKGLYDVVLALRSDVPVANDLDAGERPLIVITGANQGGKSTFLRSLGIAQLMAQSGMFAPAQSFATDVRDGVLTHFRREEDTHMQSGKLDEELKRMSQIVDHLSPHAILLSNESFASTDEREGSEIGRQIVAPLLQYGVKIAMVTHLYDLSNSLYRSYPQQGLFLRAGRNADGSRSFRLESAPPLATSFGADLYEQIFSEPLA